MRIQFLVVSFFLLSISVVSMAQSHKETMDAINASLEKAETISLLMAKSLENDKEQAPKTFKDGKLVTSDIHWWCSGFFPGVLWYLYENKPSEELKKYALNYTTRLEKEQFTTDNHDVGFIIFCSYGNAYRLLGKPEYKNIILQTSRSLCKRFDPRVGVIKSWDMNQWKYPVIIDNMMNLELLMWSSNNSNDKSFGGIARSHADRTIIEHFRPDNSSYHLVDYDPETNKCIKKQTVQGYADDSSWARGQGWGLYGYTMMYRETGDSRYLKHAENIAKYIINHPNLPADKIPYWDFNAPKIPDEFRDASAGAVMASAFVELSQLTNDRELSKQVLEVAETQIRTLSSPEYFAQAGTNGNFILKHSVGYMGANSEVDQPLTYADYYYIEAMMRYKKRYGQ